MTGFGFLVPVMLLLFNNILTEVQISFFRPHSHRALGSLDNFSEQLGIKKKNHIIPLNT